LELRVRVPGPNTGIAIRLQFFAHGIAGGAGFAAAVRIERAEQVLDVMAVFVGDHVSLRKLAWRTEALRQLVEEGEVEINMAVGSAVERTGRRLAFAATGRCFAVVHGERGGREIDGPRLQDR